MLTFHKETFCKSESLSIGFFSFGQWSNFLEMQNNRYNITPAKQHVFLSDKCSLRLFELDVKNELSSTFKIRNKRRMRNTQ